ncbi:MAG: sugar phosphate isomerase/epimerase [Anaerolineaceae bacterium]|nr:sugar phosphate isomerase/epimerase [Anaerolineaceae bacterium]
MFNISVFTVMLPELTPEEGAAALQRHGYAGVEWRVSDESRPSGSAGRLAYWGANHCTLPLNEESAIRARDVAAAHGLIIPGLGTYIDVGDLDNTERAMRFAQTCGARNIRVNPGRWPDADGLSYADSFARASRFLEGCQELARQYNVRAIVELHHGTITCSASLAQRLVAPFDPDFIGVLHDAGNMAREGYEHYDLGFQVLGPWLAHVHIKNASYAAPEDGGVWQAEWSPLEDGVVDWDALFSALKRAGYEGWLGIEDFSAARPVNEALPHNIGFLNAAIARVFDSA